MKHLLKQLKVKVRDLKGKEHVMSRANATDMVQHAGWSLVFEAPPTPADEFAQAPRNVRPAHELAQEQIASGGVRGQAGRGVSALAAAKAALPKEEEEDDAPEQPAARPGRKARVRAEPKDTDGEEAVAGVMAAVTAHAQATMSQHDPLADLEVEEDARVAKDD